MESRVNYTVVGLFVVVLGVIFMVLFFWLSTFRAGKSYNTYLVYVKEDVTGLSVQTPVRFNGVPVGFVKAIELDPRNPQLVRLTLRIEESTPITTSTVATLQFQGITGVLYVGLQAETVDAPLLKAAPGEKYPIIPWKPSLIVQLSQVLPEITKNVKAIGTSVQQLLNEENQELIQKSLENIKTFTQTLADNSDELDESIHYLRNMLKNTSEASKKLPDVLRKFDSTLSSAQQASSQINLAAKSAKRTFDAGQGAVANLSDQVLPSLQQSMTHLNQITSNLLGFSQELQRNPSIIIRGKQPTTPGPGEQ